MSATVISISEQEFRTYPIFDVGIAPVTEKAWFRCGEHLGIVLVDTYKPCLITTLDHPVIKRGMLRKAAKS